MPDRRHAPATLRNRAPILDVLRRVLPEAGVLLELASGSGEHVVHFAAALPDWVFQPTDVDPAALASITAWIRETAVPNVRPPLRLDVTTDIWPVDSVQAMFSANLVHIAPPEAARGMMAGAGRHLVTGGLLVVYGPFRIGGVHTTPSNAAFDADLRARDPLGSSRPGVVAGARRRRRTVPREPDSHARQQSDSGLPADGSDLTGRDRSTRAGVASAPVACEDNNRGQRGANGNTGLALVRSGGPVSPDRVRNHAGQQ